MLHDAEILEYMRDGDIVHIKVNDGTGQLQLLKFLGVSTVDNHLRYTGTPADTKQIVEGNGLAGAECERIDSLFRTQFLSFSAKPMLTIEHTGFEAELLGEIGN